MTGEQDPAPSASRTLRHTGGEIAMILFGVVLLLPGLCSLIFAIGSISDWRSSDPILQALLGLWALCIAVSGIGIVLIWLARRRARARA
jgi:hypothetical protein